MVARETGAVAEEWAVEGEEEGEEEGGEDEGLMEAMAGSFQGAMVASGDIALARIESGSS